MSERRVITLPEVSQYGIVKIHTEEITVRDAF